MQQSDHSPDYYRLREAQEREMADNAQDDAARKIHLALADRYRLLADGAAIIR